MLTDAFPCSSHSAIPLPISEHNIQNATIRVSPPHISGRNWRTRQSKLRLLPSIHSLTLLQQNDNNTVIHFLLSTEIIPLCLRIMETGSELSKTVAIFIVQKILLDETGLTYICHTYERFYAVGTVLSNMVNQLVETQAVRLLKHVVRCYLRLSDNLRWARLFFMICNGADYVSRAREALRACLPEPLRDQTFSVLLKGDMVTKRYLTTLLNIMLLNTHHAQDASQLC